jgi:hypothetical protein
MTPNFRNSMWFGNRNYMQWIVPPQINYDSSRAGKVYTAQYTNGGAWVRRSATGSRHYNFAWNLKRRDEIRAIMDYADGVYGTDDPIYFIDPFAADKNVLPQYWSVPSLGAEDAPQLQGLGDEQRPTKVATGANIIGLPTYCGLHDRQGSAEPAAVHSDSAEHITVGRCIRYSHWCCRDQHDSCHGADDIRHTRKGASAGYQPSGRIYC